MLVLAQAKCPLYTTACKYQVNARVAGSADLVFETGLTSLACPCARYVSHNMLYKKNGPDLDTWNERYESQSMQSVWFTSLVLL